MHRHRDRHSTRDLSNPFHATPHGCRGCGRYVHPLPLASAEDTCPDCRLRTVRAPR